MEGKNAKIITLINGKRLIKYVKLNYNTINGVFIDGACQRYCSNDVHTPKSL